MLSIGPLFINTWIGTAILKS